MIEAPQKPKTDSHGRPLNPDDIPALRAYQAYHRFRNRGKDHETAIELSTRVPGMCYRTMKNGKLCGAEAITPKSYTCQECKRLDACERAERQREEGRAEQDKICQVPGCAKPFRGHHDRMNCDKHTQKRIKPRSDKGKRRKNFGSKPKPAVKSNNMPATWNTAPKNTAAPGPESNIIIVPADVKVTRTELPWSRWG